MLGHKRKRMGVKRSRDTGNTSSSREFPPLLGKEYVCWEQENSMPEGNKKQVLVQIFEAKSPWTA